MKKIFFYNKILYFAENSYFQLAPGRYIFQGAEIYANLEDYDRCSISANSESSDSESDSSSDEEEMTCE